MMALYLHVIRAKAMLIGFGKRPLPNKSERRRLSRLPVAVMLRLRVSETHEIDLAQTHDVSAQGIFFHTSARIEPGQHVDAVLVFPEELTSMAEPAFVSCRGTVLRVNEEVSSGKRGVAMEVNSYDFSSSASALLEGSGCWSEKSFHASKHKAGQS